MADRQISELETTLVYKASSRQPGLCKIKQKTNKQQKKPKQNPTKKKPEKGQITDYSELWITISPISHINEKSLIYTKNIIVTQQLGGSVEKLVKVVSTFQY